MRSATSLRASLRHQGVCCLRGFLLADTGFAMSHLLDESLLTYWRVTYWWVRSLGERAFLTKPLPEPPLFGVSQSMQHYDIHSAAKFFCSGKLTLTADCSAAKGL